MSAKEKNVKASLVRTRQVIANKFRKLNRNLILQEKKLAVKYAPITDSIDKLIKNKNIQSSEEKKRNYKSDDDSKSDNEMDVESDHGDDLMGFDDNFGRKTIKIESKRELNQPPIDLDAETLLESEKLDSGSSNLYNKIRIFTPGSKSNPWPSLNLNEKRVSTRKATTCKRKNDRISEQDSLRFNADELDVDESNDANQSTTKNHSKRKFSKNPASSLHNKLEKNRINVRNTAISGRKNKRSIQQDASRLEYAPKHKPTVVLSLDDFNERGQFIGFAPKRRKIEISAKKLTKIHNQKQQKRKKPAQKDQSNNSANTDDHLQLEQQQKPKKKKVTLSLNNGLATKRRKIEITEEKLAQIKSNELKPKKRRIKYSGKGVEKKFIPYSENIVYEYYDDPNELVERLMLLTSSKGAGNSNHDQEMNSIVEELRERNIIN